MTITKFKLIFSTLALASLCGLSAKADDSDQNKNRQRGQQTSQSERDSRDEKSDRQQTRSQQQRSQENRQAGRSSQTSGRPQVEPLGWISVASDYNQDGFYDAVETIYYYDLKERVTRADSGSKLVSNPPAATSGLLKRSASKERLPSWKAKNHLIPAEHVWLPRSKIPKAEQPQFVWGQKSKMSQLNLSEGDRISAEGLLTRKDGKQVMLATKVSANGQTVQQKLSQRQGIKQMTGTLKSLRETQSKRGDGTYLVGEVKTDSGTQKIHFGRKDRLSKLNLSEGDDIKVLATSGKVSGKQAMLAVQVTANNQTAKVLRADSRQDGQSQRNQRQDRNRNSDNERSDS